METARVVADGTYRVIQPGLKRFRVFRHGWPTQPESHASNHGFSNRLANAWYAMLDGAISTLQGLADTRKTGH
jgi:hypothetical protein